MGSNNSSISIVENGADYMKDDASPDEKGSYLTGDYYDTVFGYFNLDWSSFIGDNVIVRIMWGKAIV